MAESNLSAERLRELLHYDPETGAFMWREGANAGRKGLGKRRPDIEAGCLCVHHGYRSICINYRRYAAHRLAWLYVNGVWPTGEIDHVNGVRSDNRIANLRDVTRSVNNQNKRTSHGKSGLLGAFWHSRSGTWNARITVDGKPISLGYHKTAELAHAAYLAAKRKLHEGCTI